MQLEPIAFSSNRWRDSRNVRAVSAQRVVWLEQLDESADRFQKQRVERRKLMVLVGDDVHNDVTSRPEQRLFAEHQGVESECLLRFRSGFERSNEVVDT